MATRHDALLGRRRLIARPTLIRFAPSFTHFKDFPP
jgi:hypothetical protein